MRNIILTIFVAAILISCGKEKDPAPASLIGKWNITEVKTTSSLGGQSLIDMLVASGMTEEEAKDAVKQAEGGIDIGGQFSGTIEFKADGTWVGTAIEDDGTEQSAGTWKLSSDSKSLTLTSNDDSGDGDEGSAPDTFTVKTLTATDMQLDLLIKADDESLPLDVTVSLSFKRL